ncbi:glycosyltransferase family 1 protein [Ancylomarina euxinus]|uniref:Glycosyltransferase family 1 protein n=1 Tax=Ancylomarina euxinus TaxID=2283627 RepID=A0A425Y6I5_9BACT|nr:glycosyltransferase family 4 protein [Ancylomarina euxinus]MCZ4694010.1 glycosyltransferase family 4 protein [Ancylomarina euxinus]MUP14570.1 glycosyltransferase [Ancylomarina euxinus]RRG24119.1 glycosyltransferase family 1 protein [Ancylomarina euxinus]
MKILIVHTRNDIISGAEYAITDMLNTLPADLEFEMMTPGYGVLSEYLEGRGFKVHVKKYSGPRRRYPGLYQLSSFLLMRWLKKQKFDLILCNTFAASFRMSLGAKWAGIKIAIYTREYFSKKKQVNLNQVNRASSIIAVSEDVKDYYGDMHPHVNVCHDTIDIGLINKRLKDHKRSLLEESVFNIGFIGRITRYKQPDLVIRALPDIIKKIPNVHVHIVGKAVSQEYDFELGLKQLVKELKIDSYVTFWGYRSDSIELMKDFDVLCLTSDREPFPRTILESMLAGTPVVCSNTGGCKEMVRDNITGLHFDVCSDENSVKLAKQIIRLSNDKVLYKEIVTNSLNFIQETFGPKDQTKHFFNTLRLISK